MEKAVDLGLKECQQCGLCCTQTTCIPFPDELPDIANYLGISVKVLLDTYYRDYTFPKTNVVAKRPWKEAQKCIFLIGFTKCEIYKVRPIAAQVYRCWEDTTLKDELLVTRLTLAWAKRLHSSIKNKEDFYRYPMIFPNGDWGKFTCAKCGKCCTSPLQLMVSDEDIARIESLGHKDFHHKWRITYISKWSGKREKKIINVVDQSSGYCIFHNPETKLCEIYEHRPDVCRLFPYTNFSLPEDLGKIVLIMKPQPFCKAVGKGPQVNYEDLISLTTNILRNDYIIYGKIVTSEVVGE